MNALSSVNNKQYIYCVCVVVVVFVLLYSMTKCNDSVMSYVWRLVGYLGGLSPACNTKVYESISSRFFSSSTNDLPEYFK